MDRFQDDILPMLLGVLWFAAAVVVGLKLLWRRPVAGLGKVCNHCGYSTAGREGKTCPECGRNPATLRPLRARWVVAGVLLLLIVGQLFAYKERRGEQWWARLVPTTVWCLGERWWPAAEGSWRSSLVGYRLENYGGWGWQVRLALGDRLPSAVWEACVKTPERWPEGEPIVTRLAWSQLMGNGRKPGWCGVSVEAETASAPGDTAAIYWRPAFIECGMSSGRRDETIVLPPAAAGAVVVPVRVQARVDGALVLDKVIRRTVQVVPRGTGILNGISDAGLTERIVNRTSVDLCAGQWRIMPAAFDDRAFPGVAMGVRVELLREGRVVKLIDPVSLMEVEAWRSPRLDDDWWYSSFDLPNGFIEDGAETPYVERKTALPSGLRLRVSGDELASLRSLRGDSYWTGSVEMPLEEWADRTKHQMDYLKAEKRP
ncbi:MAG: hypothetical protein QM783_03535 [Phycisphaerales bacterium]